MAYTELLNEDRLFELYDIMMGYVADTEREELAQHIHDWMRSWEAPASVVDGMSDHDPYLSELGKNKKYQDEYEYEEEEEDADTEEDWED